MTDTSWTSKRREILEEHEEIRARILEIETELDRLLDHPAQPGESWELPGLVEALRDQFRRHFEHEESGGLLWADSECYDSEMLRLVADLIAQHREFEREIERILSEFDFSFVPGKTVQSCFDGDLRNLISEFAVHEAAENVLLDKLVARVEKQRRQLP